MHITIAYYNSTDVARLFGDDRADWQAFEVLAAEERGELHRVRTEATDEGDARFFGVGRHWWEAVENGDEVAFIDEESAQFADVADFLWCPLIDPANPVECVVHVSRERKPWTSLEATARETSKGYLNAEIRSPFFGVAEKIERLLSFNGYSVLSVPWGEENALTLAGGVKVWAD